MTDKVFDRRGDVVALGDRVRVPLRNGQDVYGTVMSVTDRAVWVSLGLHPGDIEVAKQEPRED